ncbi:MAG: M23 family metallopeptidase [Acidimicrobiia bacterium]
MSFGKRPTSFGGAIRATDGTGTAFGTPAERRGGPAVGARRRRRYQRQAQRRRRGQALSLVIALAAAALFYRNVSASAQADEPDLLPFWGAFQIGCTWDNGCGGGHHGGATPAVDFVMAEGSPIVAAGAGVARLYEDSCAGRYIEIWHGGVRKYSRYLHLSSYAIRDGEAVARGQIIGYSGNTGAAGGCSTGPHLHYDELNADRHRVDPGPMAGWSGGVWVSYPSAIGFAGWGQVPAFGAWRPRNDFTVTAGTPTTLLSTTTVPSPTPTTAPSPVTTGPPPVTTAPPPVTAPPLPSALAEGTLFRAGDAPNVFVYAAGGPWWVPDPDQLELLGGWGKVQLAGPRLDALLSAMPFRPLQYRAFAEAGDGTLYWCAGGSPWPLRSMEELAALQAAVGGSGWHRLPGGAGVAQWACGGTVPGTVFRPRTSSAYWMWTDGGWARFGDAAALRAAGYDPAAANLIPA